MKDPLDLLDDAKAKNERAQKRLAKFIENYKRSPWTKFKDRMRKFFSRKKAKRSGGFPWDVA